MPGWLNSQTLVFSISKRGEWTRRERVIVLFGSDFAMEATELTNIVKAVNRWLSYQVLCGREALFSEAYLGQPLAEYLIHRHSGKFEAEVDHPVLNEPKPGRPRQIDYVLRTRDAKVIEVAIECKWISTTPYDKQRIINDILRLECVRVPGRHVKRLLLVAGRKQEFDKNFRKLQVNIGNSRANFTKSLLPFSLEKPLTVQPALSESPFREYYERFSVSFNAGVPKSFKTLLVGRRSADDISVSMKSWLRALWG